MLEKTQCLFDSNLAMLRAIFLVGKKASRISATMSGHQAARNQVIIRVAIIVNIYCRFNLRQAPL